MLTWAQCLLSKECLMKCDSGDGGVLQRVQSGRALQVMHTHDPQGVVVLKLVLCKQARALPAFVCVCCG